MRATEFTLPIIPQELPRITETSVEFEEVYNLFNTLRGDDPVIGKSYAVLMLEAVPPGRIFLVSGHASPLQLHQIIEQRPNSEFEFVQDDQRIKYPNFQNSRLAKTLLFSDPQHLFDARIMIHLKLADWNVKTRL